MELSATPTNRDGLGYFMTIILLLNHLKTFKDQWTGPQNSRLDVGWSPIQIVGLNHPSCINPAAVWN